MAGEKRTRSPKLDPKIVDDSSDDDDDIGPVLPPKQVVSTKRPRTFKLDPKIIDDSSDEEEDNESNIGPVLPPEPTTNVAENMDFLDELPIQNEVTLGTTHDSFVSCLTLDRKGTRLVSGSIDSTIKLWDFNTMNRSLQTFKTQSPLDSSPLRCAKFSATGGALLCSGGASTAAILDRDGYILSQTAKGDMYIVDMARTKGHIGPIHHSSWRPCGTSAPRMILTTSADATIRLWDITRTTTMPMVDIPVASQVRVTKLRNSRGAKTVATAADWVADGKTCAIGCTDGRVKIVDPETYSIRPVAESEVILKNGAEATSVCVAPQSTSPLILVRSTDDCLRVLDQRMLSSTLAEFQDLPNAVAETNATFIGSDGEFFTTGTSANRKGGTLRGSLRIFSRLTMKEVWKTEMDETTGSVICTVWHPNINQILYGTGDGRIHVLYNETTSHRGVLDCLTKSDYRKSHGMASVGVGEIFTPYSLHKRNGGGGGGDSSKGVPQLSNRGKREAAKALKPKAYSGPEELRAGSSTTLAKFLSRDAITQDWTRDPRQALLRYAEEAEKNPVFTSAYKETQPVTLLASKTAEQEEEESRRAVFERDLLRKKT